MSRYRVPRAEVGKIDVSYWKLFPNLKKTTATSTTLFNVVVEYDLPFLLRVQDSIRQESVVPEYRDYIVLVRGFAFVVRFDKKVRNIGGAAVATEDYRGLLTYVAAEVHIPYGILRELDIPLDFRSRADELLALSLEVVNRFVDVYQQVVRAFWIQHVTAADIPRYNMTGVRADNSIDPFMRGSLGTGVGLGVVISQEADAKIRDLLVSDWEPDDLEQLRFLVDRLTVRESAWSAALAIEVYFEARTARMLRTVFLFKGATEAEADRNFEKDGLPRSITNLLRTYVRQLAGINVDDAETGLGKAYVKWCVDARDLRNDIAHGKQTRITMEQAQAAIRAVMSLNDELDKTFLPLVGRTFRSN